MPTILYFLEPLTKLVKKNNIFPIILTLVKSLRRPDLGHFVSVLKVSITGTHSNLAPISVSNNLKSVIKHFSSIGYLYTYMTQDKVLLNLKWHLIDT